MVCCHQSSPDQASTYYYSYYSSHHQGQAAPLIALSPAGDRFQQVAWLVSLSQAVVHFHRHLPSYLPHLIHHRRTVVGVGHGVVAAPTQVTSWIGVLVIRRAKILLVYP